MKCVNRSLALTLFALLLLVTSCSSEVTEPRPVWDATSLARISLEHSDAAGLPQVTGLDPVKDWFRLLRLNNSERADENLYLKGITTLSVAEAEAIASMPARRVFLRDLEHLNADLARSLTAYVKERTGTYTSGSPGRQLYLDGLQNLDLETAKVLVAAGPDILSLDGLKTLDLDVAKVLVETVSSLSLDGLEELSVELARTLATWDSVGEQVFLSLRGLRTLSPEIAQELSRTQGWMLDLSGLSELSPEAAQKLGQIKCPCLALSGLQQIPLATATVMSRWQQKFLVMDGFKTLDEETRRLIEAGSAAQSFRSLTN